MFECGITEQGYGYNSRCFRGSPNTDLLQQEVLGQIDQAQFEPAVYNHFHVTAYMQGTVMFLIHDGKPHVRIFLNQEDSEIKGGKDFIAPQFAWVPNNTKFKWIETPPTPGGVAVLGLDIDATGHVHSAKVVYEHPAEMHFGGLVAGPIRDALFIPAFRDGKPVACHFNWPVVFTGPGRRSRTG
jgi:hypothetical protein